MGTILRTCAGVAGRSAFRSLVATAPLAAYPVGQRVWEKGWSQLTKTATGSVRMRLHGRDVIIPVGYAYPAFLRRWPSYNSPLVAAVRESAASTGSPVRVVDVGAAVGDTALLLLDRCSESVKEIVCIEGDPEFFALLETNLRGLARTRLILDLLSDTEEEIAELVRTHPGTRSALGSERRPARRLDDVDAAYELGGIGVLKTDVDGLDGRVLAGATGLIERDRPIVLFEWHPRLCLDTGNGWDRSFDTLRSTGYTSFAWFDKTGIFSHVDDGAPDRIEALASVCLEDRGPMPDWHYDVIALHPTSATRAERLAAAAHHPS